VSREALLSERKKSRDRVFTEPCSEHCTHLCGVCGKSVGVRRHELDLPSAASPLPVPDRRTTHRAILAFSKTGRAVFYSHLDVMTIFERSLLRAGIFPAFTQGYNPKPRMEFASPLALGISSEQEIVSLDFFSATGDEDLQRRLNHALPDGIEVCRSGLARPAGSVEKPVKRKSLMSLYWGSTYQISAEGGGKAWAPLSSALLSAKIRSRMRDIQEVEEAGEGLLVCHQVIQGEPSSILKRLSELIEGPPFERGIRIRRIATWARDDSGKKASYFDLLT
jgi:radical SAM-linked protein